MSDHATPWTQTGWEELVVNDCRGNTVVVSIGCDRDATLREIKDRTAYLVRAVNAHDALIAALRELVRYHDTHNPQPTDRRYAESRVLHDALTDARAALALAEGKE